MTFTWGALILAILQFGVKLYTGLQERRLIDAGYDKAIAEAASQILKNNQYAKEVMASINAMPDSDVDKLLQQLENSNK